MHILMSGPLRPNIEYMVANITRLKSLLPEAKTHLVYWKTNEDDHQILLQNFDFVHACDEPTDEDLKAKKLEQTKQHKIQDIKWSLQSYKMFLGFRLLVENSQIEDDKIVIRVRSDLYVLDSMIEFLKTVPNNVLQYPYLRGCLGNDWFGICTYSVFKKVYYFSDDKEYNGFIKECFNPEEVIIKKAQQGNVKINHIKLKMAICREYVDDSNKKLHFYD